MSQDDADSLPVGDHPWRNLNRAKAFIEIAEKMRDTLPQLLLAPAYEGCVLIIKL